MKTGLFFLQPSLSYNKLGICQTVLNEIHPFPHWRGLGNAGIRQELIIQLSAGAVERGVVGGVGKGGIGIGRSRGVMI